MRQRHGVSVVGPIILILIGVVFLLSNLGVLPSNVWDTIWKLWPVLLIAVGLDIIIGRRSVWGSLVVILVILGILAGVYFATQVGVFGAVFGVGSETAGSTYSQSFNVDGPLVLEADVPIGDVTVQVGSDSTVLVEATRRAWASDRDRAEEILQNIGVEATQLGSTVRVVATGLSGEHWSGRSPRVDVIITVPQRATVSIDARVGSVTVTGTQGDLDVTADVGQVRVRNIVPVRRLHIVNRVGNIELSGSLVSGARYDLSSDVGRVALTIPASSSFSLDAKSDVGSVKVDFDVAGSSGRNNLVGKEVTGTVGAASTTELILRSRVGSIEIDKIAE